MNSGIQNDIDDLQAKINSPETAKQIQLFDNLTAMQTEVETYLTSVTNLRDAFDSKPVILGDKYDVFQEAVDKTVSELSTKVEKARIINPQYADGKMSFEVECSSIDEPTQKLPAQFAENLMKTDYGKDYFVDVTYSNYSVSEITEQTQTVDPATGQVTNVASDKKKSTVNFSITVTMKGEKSIYVPAETNTENADGSETEKEAE